MQITLTTNRTITLVRLRQWFTYYGLLAGIPFRAGNQEIIDRALAKAKAECMQGLNPILIPPVATPMQYHPLPDENLKMRDVSPAQHQYNWNARLYETLPPVVCIGQFDSGELNRRDSEPYSSLVIVWFQGDFALPINAGVQAQIERLDWEGLASDWVW